MKMYKVIVDGTEYEVGVEPMNEADAKSAAAPKAVQPAPAPQASAPAGQGEAIRSPMPGTILSVNIQQGASVKKGQILMVLEAMKMENEIICPRDGVVGSVNVQSGVAVDTDALLCTLI